MSQMCLWSIIVGDKGVCEDIFADSEVTLNQSETGHKIVVHISTGKYTKKMSSWTSQCHFHHIPGNTSTEFMPSLILTKIILKAFILTKIILASHYRFLWWWKQPFKLIQILTGFKISLTTNYKQFWGLTWMERKFKVK